MMKGAQQPVALNGNNAGLEPQYPPPKKKARSASHDNNNGPKTSKYSG